MASANVNIPVLFSSHIPEAVFFSVFVMNYIFAVFSSGYTYRVNHICNIILIVISCNNHCAKVVSDIIYHFYILSVTAIVSNPLSVKYSYIARGATPNLPFSTAPFLSKLLINSTILSGDTFSCNATRYILQKIKPIFRM